MKQVLLFLGCFSVLQAGAQITITSSDMPVVDDTLRYSNTLATDIDVTATGADMAWDFSTLTPLSQGLDHYQSAADVNILYAVTISPTAYGYKVSDSIPFASLAGISANNVYNFFNKKSSPSRYVTEAFAAEIDGIPTPINYSNEDEIFYFPLAYGNAPDTSTFKLSILTYLKQTGTRITTVDGWGTIVTPYFTTPTDCIRTRAEINEVDSVSFGSFSFGFPRNTVEYKWLTNNEHYPALWVTANVLGGTEIPTTARYRDNYHNLAVDNVPTRFLMVQAYPTPATDEVTINVPADWNKYSVEVFGEDGKVVLNTHDQATISMTRFAPGNYFVRLINGQKTAFAHIIRQ